MGAEKARVITIHRTSKYEKQFIQVDYENIGKVFGKLSKTSSKNLYIYFMRNKDGFVSTLSVSDYANWLGDPYAKDGVILNQSIRAKYNKQIREGLDELIEYGYIVGNAQGFVFDFYEFGTKSSESNELLQEEQKVTEVTNCSESDKKFSEVTDCSVKEQIVSEVTDSSESDKLSSQEQIVSEVTNSCAFVF